LGAGVGFFVGPQYAGWRAQAAGWHLGTVADWQRPLLELGAAGLAAGIAFLFVAKEAEHRARIPFWRWNRARTAPHAEASSAPPRISSGASDPPIIRGGAELAPAWVGEASSVAGSDGNRQIQDTPGPGGVSVHSGHPLGSSLRN